MLITWPDGATQLIKAIAGNQRLTVDRQIAQKSGNIGYWTAYPPIPLVDITDDIGLRVTAPETDYIDFNVQRLIPHKLSQYGPALAVADVNGDGLDDFVMGGAKGYPTQLAIQQPGGRFRVQPLTNDKSVNETEDQGLLFFDADGDGDPDLYIVSGGVEAEPGGPGYRIQLGVFGDAGNALKLYEQVADQGYQGQIQSRVMVGPFADRAAAEKARQALRRAGVGQGVLVPPEHSK